MNQKEILVISLTIFLTITAWVLSEVYSIHRETPTEAQIESTKLNYTIDTAILDQLEKKTPSYVIQ
jgi:hypothetical protein